MNALRARPLVFLLLLAAAAPATAGVFYSRDEALKFAFPATDSVEARDLFLTPTQVERLQQAASAKVESPLVTVYEARKDGRVEGLAIFDTQVVKTMPETLMVVMTPDGQVKSTVMCAFQEPEEYLPTARWFEQFKGKDSGSELRVGRDVAGVAGSTLSSRAITTAVRRAIALHTVWRSCGR